jgi:hypothetical protein
LTEKQCISITVVKEKFFASNDVSGKTQKTEASQYGG